MRGNTCACSLTPSCMPHLASSKQRCSSGRLKFNAVHKLHCLRNHIHCTNVTHASRWLRGWNEDCDRKREGTLQQKQQQQQQLLQAGRQKPRDWRRRLLR